MYPVLKVRSWPELTLGQHNINNIDEEWKMSKDISIVSTELPAHIKLGSGLGNENVQSDHLSVPRVKQLQKMSNEVDENHSDYMEGAKVGDFINTVTGENYGQEM